MSFCRHFQDESSLPIILTCAFALSAYAFDERILVDAKINGEPVRLAFDTGTGLPFVLFSKTAQKLGLKVTPPADATIGPGQTPIGWTDSQEVELEIELESINVRTTFAVVETPSYLRFTEDGLLGWPALSNNVLSLDCETHTISLFTNTVETLRGWAEYRIQTNSDNLALELPGFKNPKHSHPIS